VDEVLNRVPTVSRGQITAVTKKPREFFRVTNASQGCPTFLLDGRLLGIAVTRSVKSKSSHVVIIPASDVSEIADQARAANSAPEKKPDSR
jgi:hypothetical protein